MTDISRSNIAISQTSSVNLTTTNMKNYQAGDIKNMLASAKSVQVVIPQTTIDSVGAGLALAWGLKKKGISVSVFTTTATDNNYGKLSGLDMLTNQLAKNDLVISIEHPLDQIDRVSYNDDGGRLNLVVQTKTGSSPIQTDKIIINNGSLSSDVSILLGDETGLGANSSIVNQGNWIVISDKQVNPSWAKSIIVDPSAPFSEILTFLLPLLNLEMDPEVAKNLLIGLRVATQSFSVNVSPETFEAGALCLRATQVAFTPPVEATPIENVEKSGNLVPGTNQPNPTPTA